jgi:hypothetical protein
MSYGWKNSGEVMAGKNKELEKELPQYCFIWDMKYRS